MNNIAKRADEVTVTLQTTQPVKKHKLVTLYNIATNLVRKQPKLVSTGTRTATGAIQFVEEGTYEVDTPIVIGQKVIAMGKIGDAVLIPEHLVERAKLQTQTYVNGETVPGLTDNYEYAQLVKAKYLKGEAIPTNPVRLMTEGIRVDNLSSDELLSELKRRGLLAQEAQEEQIEEKKAPVKK